MNLPANVQGGKQLANGDWELPRPNTPGAQQNAGLYYSPSRQMYYTTQGGKQTWISPMAFDHADRRGLGEGQSLTAERGQFNQHTGEVDHPFNWTNTLALAAGAAIAAPAVASAFGAGGAGATTGAGGALGPSTAANMAATTAAAHMVPASLAAGVPMAAASTVPWGTMIGAGTQLFGNLFGAHQQANSAREAADVIAAAQKYSADLQSKAAADALGFTKNQAQNAFQNNEVARRGNFDQWVSSRQRIGSVGALLGWEPPTTPAYVPGVDPKFSDPGAPTAPSVGQALTGGAPTAPGGGQGGAAALKALLDQGVDPQSAVTQFNQKYGRTTGNEAVYYDPSQHGGVATIGLPDAYLAKPGGSWDITQRGGAPAAQTPYSTGSIGSYLSTPTPFMPVPITPALAMPTPYRPGSVGSYLNG